ncbi:hypothetical protein [Paenisporosarcina sp. OV554]|uniref:hypothetical protein n=1 Tax=Paenisporosarcina sp. OV554 TaxID=2135694 RepID=UPI000D397943|nr:hypothetical protein [Paenisporosarcina sp. OV554]PUB06328.1 hypothetical protein C8K15_1497 [Paenisporosarcina sp. OV554]
METIEDDYPANANLHHIGQILLTLGDTITTFGLALQRKQAMLEQQEHLMENNQEEQQQQQHNMLKIRQETERLRLQMKYIQDQINRLING